MFQDGEFLTLPVSASLSSLNEIKNQLDKERSVVQKSSQGSQAPIQNAGAGAATGPGPVISHPPSQQTSLQKIQVFTCLWLEYMIRYPMYKTCKTSVIAADRGSWYIFFLFLHKMACPLFCSVSFSFILPFLPFFQDRM